MLRHALQVMSHVTVCSVSAVLCYGMLCKGCLMLKCTQQGQSCVTACLASVVLRYYVLSECCFTLPHA